MANRPTLTPEGFAQQLAGIRSQAVRVADLTSAQFNWQPDAGRRWSIGQCLDHIARTNAVYVPAVMEAVRTARPRPNDERRPATPNALGRWFVSSLEPPVRRRLKAPAKVEPASALELDETTRRLTRSLDDVALLFDRAWQIDLDGARFANPFLGGLRAFNASAGLLILVAHARRHLWQAAQVRAQPDFPSA